MNYKLFSLFVLLHDVFVLAFKKTSVVKSLLYLNATKSVLKTHLIAACVSCILDTLCTLRSLVSWLQNSIASNPTRVQRSNNGHNKECHCLLRIIGGRLIQAIARNHKKLLEAKLSASVNAIEASLAANRRGSLRFDRTLSLVES